MVVCKYFLQGICMYGNKCRNEHVRGNYGNYSNSRYNSSQSSYQRRDNWSDNNHYNSPTLLSNKFATQPQYKSPVVSNEPGKSNLQEARELVSNDIKIWKNGGIWPLSCYAPFPSHQVYPGFEEHSPEEIRLEQYNAAKNGNIESVLQQLNSLHQINESKRSLLQSNGQEVVDILAKLLTDQDVSNISNASGTSFSFALAASESNVFGNSPNLAQSNAVGAQSAPFGFQSSVSFGSQPSGSSTSRSFGSNTSVPFGSKSSETIPFSFTLPESKQSLSIPNKITTPIHSNIEDLTDSEIEQFLAPTFTLGKIPLKPPTKELCIL